MGEESQADALPRVALVVLRRPGEAADAPVQLVLAVGPARAADREDVPIDRAVEWQLWTEPDVERCRWPALRRDHLDVAGERSAWRKSLPIALRTSAGHVRIALVEIDHGLSDSGNDRDLDLVRRDARAVEYGYERAALRCDGRALRRAAALDHYLTDPLVGDPEDDDPVADPRDAEEVRGAGHVRAQGWTRAGIDERTESRLFAKDVHTPLALPRTAACI